MFDNKIESMAQTEFDMNTKTPWAEVGNVIRPGASVHECLVAANLDWKVQRAPTYAKIDTDDGEKMILVPKTHTLVRSTDQRVLTVTGQSYKPVQNEEAFQVFQDFVAAGNMQMETAGSLCDGGHIWALASIGHNFELCSGEVIKGYFLLVQSHRYGHALKALFTPIRMPGGNTFIQRIKTLGSSGSYAMSHSREFNDTRIQEIKKVLGVANSSMDGFKDLVTQLSQTKMSETNGVEFLTRVFEPKVVSKFKNDGKPLPDSMTSLIENEDVSRVLRNAAKLTRSYPGHDLPSCQNTAWGYYNTVVHAMDSVMGHGVNTRLESAWFGANATKKQNAMKIAMEYVNP